MKTKRRTQGGHRAYMSQVLPEAKGFIKAGDPPQKRDQKSHNLKRRLKSSLKV